MQFAKLNNINIHYQEIGGPKDSPTLIFINSLGTDFRIWRDVIVRFVGDASILAYDKRGHGLSDVGSAPYTIEEHAEDLAALIDLMGKKDVILIGVSVGGLIAQALYKVRPDLIKAMVLCDTAAKIGTSEIWNDRISSIEIGGLDSLAEATMPRWFTEEFRKKHAAEVQGFQNMLARQSIDGYLGTCAAIRDADFSEDAKVISVPTMCVVGLEDTATTPGHMWELASLIPASRYEEMKNGAHLPFIEQPENFANLVKDFIRVLNENAPEGSSVH